MAINILDKHTANLIAAGEVVERPASAIKEMLENSADAGATRITVEIKNGGTSYFRVTDNGCGMSADDLPKAVLRHATSKISSSADLNAIGTYGFRGEALAAIAAVCDLRILTKRPEDTFGSVLHINSGEIIEQGDAGCPDGTTVAASDIFKNIPARRKFLKKDMTEGSACLAVAEKFALSRPDIAVTFLADGSIKLKTSGDGNLKNAIYSCLGKEFSSKLLELDYDYEGIKVSGYIGKPETARPSRSLQNFFVNGRYVRSGTVCAALEEGFRAFCPAGKFPAAVIFCSLDLSRVDVNIHPAKTEIKFSEEKKVFEAVLFAVRTSLGRGTSFAPDEIKQSPAQAHQNPDNAFSQKPVMTQRELAKSLGVGEVPRESTSHFRDIDNRALFHSQNESVPTNMPQRAVADPQPAINAATNRDTENSAPAGQDIKNHAGAFSYAPPKQTAPTPDLPFGTGKKSVQTTRVPDFKNAFASDSEGVAEFSKIHKLSNVNILHASSPADNLEIYAPPRKAELFPPKRTENKPIQEQISFELPEEENKKVKFRIIGQCFDSFILAEKDDVLYIIDKHAAHERILYEEIKNSVSVSSQVLLEPIRVSLTTEECAALSENKEYFEKTGFDFDTLGSASIIVRSYPEHIAKEDLADIFSALSAKLMEGNGTAAGDIFDRALFSAACKAAVKAGQKSTVFHDEYIAEKIFTSEAILYCPHGRPILTELTREKLYKMFKRT